MKYYVVYSYITHTSDTIRQGMRVVTLDHKMRETDIFKLHDVLQKEGKHKQLGITFFGLLEEEPKNEPQTGGVVPSTF